jgi:acyl-CoA thioesterase-2
VALEPGLPAPEKLRSTLEQARAEGWPEDYARGPIEFRRVRPSSWPDAPADEPVAHIEWVKPREALPDDPRLHSAALVFLADFYSHWEFERRVGRKFAYDRFRPLDHALWVHRLLRWDDWWLMKATTDVSHAGRALSRREIYTRDGVLVASTAREASIAST